MTKVLQWRLDGAIAAEPAISYLVDLGQVLDFGAVQNSQCQADHLHVLGSGGGADVSGSCPDVVDDALLQPGDQEVGALVHDLVLDTAHTVEDDGAGAAFDIVYGGVGE